jgi:hypothetical protein
LKNGNSHDVFFIVPGAPQDFVLGQSGTFKVLITKVIDDILVCGPPDEIQAFLLPPVPI